MYSPPDQLIPMSEIVHTSLLSAEHSLQEMRGRCYHGRRMMSTLFEMRVKFARLLVLYRWQKRNGEKTSTDPEFRHNSCLENALGKIRPLLRMFSRDHFTPFVPEPVIQHRRDLKKPKMSPLKLLSLVKSKKQHFQSVHIQRRTVMLIAKEFIVSFGARRDGFAQIKNLRLVWPDDVRQTKDVERALRLDITRFRKFDPQKQDVIDSMYAVFRRYFIMGQFLKVVKEIKKREAEFGFKVRKDENPWSVVIQFSKSFRTFNKVVCRMTSDRILLFSAVPLYWPLREEREYVFSKHRCSTYRAAPREFVSFSFSDASEANIPERLTLIRDCIVATRMRNIWMMLTQAVEFSPYMFLVTVVHVEKVPSFDWITLNTSADMNAPNTILRIDPHTGRLLIEGSTMYGLDMKQFRKSLDLDVSTTSRIITLMKLSRLVNSHNSKLCAMNDVTHMDIDALANQNSMFYLHLSYSRDYCIKCFMSPSCPGMEVISKVGDVIESKDMFAFGQMAYNWKCDHYFETLERSRMKLAALQLEKQLTEAGYHVQRETEKKLVIWLRPMMKVRLKLRNTMWSLSFQKSFYPFLKTGCMTFVSRSITARCTDYIVHLIKNVMRLGMFCQCIEGGCDTESCGTRVCQFWYENDVNVHFSVDSLNVHLGLGPLVDNFEALEESQFIMNPSTPLKLFMRFSRVFPLQLSKIYEFEGEEFGSWLRYSLPALFHLHRVFSPTIGWSTGSLSSHESIVLIFQRHISFNVQWKFLQGFAVVLPNTGKSHFFEIPLLIFPKLFSVPVTHQTYKVKTSELEKLRDVISNFYGDFIMVTSSGFGKMTRDQQGTFIKMKRGERHHVQLTATLTANGLSLDSENTPVVREICGAFQASIGDREKCRKLFKVIIEISTYDASYAKEVLNTIQVLQKIPWPGSICWESLYDRLRMTPSSVTLTVEKVVDGRRCQLILEFIKLMGEMQIKATSGVNTASFQGFESFAQWAAQCDPFNPFLL